jgi:hypothetical protein
MVGGGGGAGFDSRQGSIISCHCNDVHTSCGSHQATKCILEECNWQLTLSVIHAIAQAS